MQIRALEEPPFGRIRSLRGSLGCSSKSVQVEFRVLGALVFDLVFGLGMFVGCFARREHGDTQNGDRLLLTRDIERVRAKTEPRTIT